MTNRGNYVENVEWARPSAKEPLVCMCVLSVDRSQFNNPYLRKQSPNSEKTKHCRRKTRLSESGVSPVPIFAQNVRLCASVLMWSTLGNKYLIVTTTAVAANAVDCRGWPSLTLYGSMNFYSKRSPCLAVGRAIYFCPFIFWRGVWKFRDRLLRVRADGMADQQKDKPAKKAIRCYNNRWSDL